MRIPLALLLCVVTCFAAWSQQPDTLTPATPSIRTYTRPKPFQFITAQPRTFASAWRETTSRKSIPVLVGITVSTLGLIAFDQKIYERTQQSGRFLHLDAERKYKTLIGFHLGSMPVNVYEAPQNLNTALYSLGEGSTSVFLCAGIFVYGKIKKDNRSLQASSQLMQALIAVGITTQLMKRISGRESPFASTASGGVWRPLTNPGEYQKNVPRHDAFPSGHLATMMATTTVLAENFPEKKWIRPVGYTLMTLTSFAMINNGVHWAGDYPLALGVGYVFGHAAVNMDRWIKGKPARKRSH